MERFLQLPTYQSSCAFLHPQPKCKGATLLSVTTDRGGDRTGSQFPAEYNGDAFVVMRGSWNRNPPSGYELAHVMF